MIKRYWKIFSSCERGAALIEFCICVQVFILLFLAGVQLVQFIVVAERTDYMVNTATDALAEGNPGGTAYTQTDMADHLHEWAISLYESPALSILGNLSAFGNAYTTSYVFKDVMNKNGNYTVMWRFCGAHLPHDPNFHGGPSFDQIGGASAGLGGAGAVVTMPAGFSLNPGEEVLIGQAQTTWTLLPLFSSFTSIYRSAFYIPRTGSVALTPNWVSGGNNDGPC